MNGWYGSAEKKFELHGPAKQILEQPPVGGFRVLSGVI
jgi:hypothetical protein